MTFANQTISEFLENVASATVIPSGGAVAAVGGATGAALCEMVCIHTIGKDGYANVERELATVRDELGEHRRQLLELAEEDSAAVDALQEAFQTSDREDDGQTVEQAARSAVEAPLEVAETCLSIVEHAIVITEKGNQNAIADVGTGAFFAHAALQSSLVTRQVNRELIENATFLAEIERRSTEIDDSATRAFEQVKENVGDAR